MKKTCMSALYRVGVVSASIILGFPLITSCTSAPENPPQALGGPLASGADVVTDEQGNFMAVWKSGASVWTRYYPGSIPEPPFRSAYGDTPRLSMGVTGQAALTWTEENGTYGNRDVYVRLFDAATTDWQQPGKAFHSTGPHQITGPDVSVADDYILLTALNGDRLRTTGYDLNVGTWWALRSVIPQLPTVHATRVRTDVPPTLPSANRGSIPVPYPVLETAPRVAMSSSSQGVMAWVEFAANTVNGNAVNRGLFVSHFRRVPRRAGDPRDRSAWEGKIQLSREEIVGESYQVAISPSGFAVVVWAEKHPSVNVYATRAAVYDPQADEWTTDFLSQIYTNAPEHFSVDIDNNGNILFARDGVGALPYRYYDSSSQSWVSLLDLYVTQGGGTYTRPNVDMAPNGRAMITWEQDGDVYVADFEAGQWTNFRMIGSGEQPKIATDDMGNCLGLWLDNGFVYEYNCEAPVARFVFSPASPNEGEQVDFDASASTDNGRIVRYEWDFNNDGNIDTRGVNASYVFSSTGNYTVRLIVTDDRGLQNETVQEVSVSNLNGRAPNAAINFDPTSPLAGDTVSFDASQSNDPDGSIVRYEWDMDNNGSFELVQDLSGGNSVPPTSRRYNFAGTYTVRLRVTDDQGLSDIASASFQVSEVNLSPSLTIQITGSGEVSLDVNANDTLDEFCLSQSASAQCTFPYPFGTVIDLVFEPFGTAGWSATGCDSIMNGVCTVTINTSRTVNVVF